jgi:hypothetical protein
MFHRRASLLAMTKVPMAAPPMVSISNGRPRHERADAPPGHEVAAEHAGQQKDQAADRQHERASARRQRLRSTTMAMRRLAAASGSAGISGRGPRCR